MRSDVCSPCPDLFRVQLHAIAQGAARMQIKAEEISSIIREQVKSFEKQVDVAEVGSVLQVGASIAKFYGLDGAMAGDLPGFPGGFKGIALNLEAANVGPV